jgi:hypothetical protein
MLSFPRTLYTGSPAEAYGSGRYPSSLNPLGSPSADRGRTLLGERGLWQ